MKLVKDVLARKGEEVFAIGADASVYDALVLMAQKNVGALIVMDGARIAGILSERDYARKVILRGQSSKELKVGTIMTRSVVSVRPEESVKRCMTLMTRERIRHLPVLENLELRGVISIGDVVKALLADQEELIDQLQEYIRGSN